MSLRPINLAQRRVLKLMADGIDLCGTHHYGIGFILGSFGQTHHGKVNWKTVKALEVRGLIRGEWDHFATRWSLTDAGRREVPS